MKIEIVSVMWLGVIKHSGLKVTFPNSHSLVYANSPARGVARQTLAEFAKGRAIASSLYMGPLPPALIVARAEQMIGRKYDLLAWNCDHFVSAALGFPPESKQLQAFSWALAATLLLTRLTA